MFETLLPVRSSYAKHRARICAKVNAKVQKQMRKMSLPDCFN